MKPDAIERIYPSSGEEYSKPTVLLIIRIILSAALLVGSYFVKLSGEITLAVLAATALIAGYDIIVKAVKDSLKRDFLRENLLVAVAAIISFAIGRRQEGIAALLLLQIVYIVRDYALFNTRKTITEIIEPNRKMLKGSDSDAALKTDDASDSVFSVFEGVAVPNDCVVISGSGSADLSFITGNNKKVSLKTGDFLPAGSICTGGQFKAKAAGFPENAINKRLAAILSAGYAEMTETEKLWTRALSWFLPLALCLSLVLMLVLPLIYQFSVTETLRRISTIIAIASPCGILLSLPLTYFSGMALARRLGIIFSSAKSLESSETIKAVVFAKSGTLTEKSYIITEIKTDKMDPSTFLKVAAYASAGGTSRYSKAISAAYDGEITKELISDFTEHPSGGISVSLGGIRILFGLDSYLEENGVEAPGGAVEGTALHLSVDGVYAGRMVLGEEPSAEATREYFAGLNAAGASRIAMVSGDRREADRIIASKLGIDEYYAECDESDMTARIAEIKARIDKRGKLAFVADSENDLRLFEAADVEIAVNGISAHADLPKTAVIVMEDGIGRVPDIIGVSRKVKHYVLAGILICCFVKLLLMALAAVGYCPVWFGLLLDFAVSLIVLLNCTRICAKAKFRKAVA
ncbi:MAG: HAD family hydrolase [Clostridia bacterium]|nr:HAD family hydrolase [Clostridia bacterium]